MRRKVYVASSWRNKRQPKIVNAIRAAGHMVYDFRNPVLDDPSEKGFHWSDIGKNWEMWTPAEYILALQHPLAVHGYTRDFDAMKWADTMVLVQPCGRSAHLELGWAAGAGKKTAILLEAGQEPELMVKMVDVLCTTLGDLLCWLRTPNVLPHTDTQVGDITGHPTVLNCACCLAEAGPYSGGFPVLTVNEHDSSREVAICNTCKQAFAQYFIDHQLEVSQADFDMVSRGRREYRARHPQKSPTHSHVMTGHDYGSDPVR